MPLDLSRREFDLLHYLTLHAGQVVTRRDLLTYVWQMPYGGADKTVDVHVSWLRRKLGETAQRPRYLHTVRGVGNQAQPAGTRLRIVALVVATSSLVLVSFLVPLALVLRTLAADRAVSTATVEAQSMAPLVTTLDPRGVRLAVAQVNAEDNTPVTIFLPDGTVAGKPAPWSPSVRLAMRGQSFSTFVPGGVEVLVAVEGLPGGTAVIRSFVPDTVLRHGVTRAWLLLLGVGAFLLLLSVTVADQLARSLVRPLTGLALAADRLASGDLSARATVAGPPEVRRARPRPESAGGAHRRPAGTRTGERRRPVPPTADAADRAAHRRRVAARQPAPRGRHGDGTHGQRDHPGGQAAARRSRAKRLVRRRRGHR